jgi:hypothetical protein
VLSRGEVDYAFASGKQIACEALTQRVDSLADVLATRAQPIRRITRLEWLVVAHRFRERRQDNQTDAFRNVAAHGSRNSAEGTPTQELLGYLAPHVGLGPYRPPCATISARRAANRRSLRYRLNPETMATR